MAKKPDYRSALPPSLRNGYFTHPLQRYITELVLLSDTHTITVKTAGKRISFIIIALGIFLCLMSHSKANAQGRIVINEYMPWPGNACGTGADFVELLNMGPGPMNIGGYILTDGDYAITIPSGTTLNPGQFFVISGQDMLPSPCGNIAQNVTVNLNWATCNCTSGIIPATGDGFLTDGGSANEQVVLLNPSGGLVDAVARSLPVEPSATITTKAGTGFPQVTFDLDLMSITYETIGESAGRGNSFARRIDGACGWLKDTQQSGGATNNTPGEVNDLTFTETTTMNSGCLSGNTLITLTTTPSASYFPMNYILGIDSDNDGVFTAVDDYVTGVDNTAPTIPFNNLPLGKYSVNVEPVQGCNSQTLTFYLLPCIILDHTLGPLKVMRTDKGFVMTATLTDAEDVAQISIEGGNAGRRFVTLDTIAFLPRSLPQTLQYNGHTGIYDSFRLLITDKNGKGTYSEIVFLDNDPISTDDRVVAYPNPVSDVLHLGFGSPATERAMIRLSSVSGSTVRELRFNADQGRNRLDITMDGLPPGLYFFRIMGLTTGHRSEGKFIKR